MMNTKEHKKGKGRVRMLIMYFLIAVIVIAGIAGMVGWKSLMREHDEARNLPLDHVNFNQLKDGTYVGEYPGGMYKWRANTTQVVVKQGKVADIQLLNSLENPEMKNVDYLQLYKEVIAAQSLDVDLISGATLTSKAYLAGIQSALEEADK